MPFKLVEFEWQKLTECQVERRLPVFFCLFTLDFARRVSIHIYIYRFSPSILAGEHALNFYTLRNISLGCPSFRWGGVGLSGMGWAAE